MVADGLRRMACPRTHGWRYSPVDDDDDDVSILRTFHSPVSSRERVQRSTHGVPVL